MEQNRATQIMEQGYGWSEAVLLAVCQKFGIENEIIPGIASCFAGGIGNTGAVCGAVTGAVMAIGLIKEREEWFSNLAVAQEFRSRFEAEMKTINCRELTGIDLTTPDGIDKLMKSDIPKTVCFPAVSTAYRIVVDQLKETS